MTKTKERLLAYLLDVAEVSTKLSRLGEPSESVLMQDLCGATTVRAYEMVQKMIAAHDGDEEAAIAVWLPIIKADLDAHRDLLESLLERTQDEDLERSETPLKTFCDRDGTW